MLRKKLMPGAERERQTEGKEGNFEKFAYVYQVTVASTGLIAK